MTLKAGDVVLVIATHRSTQPKPGAVGTIKHCCACIGGLVTLAFRDEFVFKVQFDATRNDCYYESELRKLEPPADEATELREATQDAPAKVTP